MKAIAIIGFMAVGKTSVAKLLAEKLGFEFLDIDEQIEDDHDMSIAEIFTDYGEGYFRQVEHEMIFRYSQLENVVIATGGGAVISVKNREMLRDNCFLIALFSTPEVILQRIQADGDTRPILSGDGEATYERICALQNERKSFYQNADLTVDTSEKSVAEIVAYILEEMHEMGAIQ